MHFGLDDIGVRVATPSAELRELLRTQRVPITPIPASDQEVHLSWPLATHLPTHTVACPVRGQIQ
jgi:hypothetical protein